MVMIGQICKIKPNDVTTVGSRELMAKLKLEAFDLILREKASLVWIFGAFSGAVGTACDIIYKLVEGGMPGRP